MNSNKTSRVDNRKIKLRAGESQRANGTYQFRWTDVNRKRHTIYGKTLEELRKKETELNHDFVDGIAPEAKYLTVNNLFDQWCELKRGLKDTTFQNYKYMYNTFVRPNFGEKRVAQIKKSDVKRFYNYLFDERCLKISTIDNVHTVLHQVFDIAVDDCLIRVNPSDNALKELSTMHSGETEKKKALTKSQQDLFLNFLKNSETFGHWYPIFAVMVGTGMRVGEATGLRWCDVDFEENTITIDHTLVYYQHADNGCYFGINSTKTKAGTRKIMMIDMVREALLKEKEYQTKNSLKCESTVQGYTDFVFINRFGHVQHQGTLNKALRRIIRDCNDMALSSGQVNPVVLPHFSCHNLRHSFTTRMIEAKISPKVVQEALGHADIGTTMNIYADVTRELMASEFSELNGYFKSTTMKNIV